MSVNTSDPEGFPPLPPTDLMARVIQPFGPDQVDSVRASFHAGGARSAEALELALAGIGRTFADFRRVLDFGSGACRIMRHLGPVAETAELHGVDIDGDMVAWSNENVPFATFATGPHEPPMPYEDGAFDLVFNHSVFTHIDARMQDLWLAEIRRVLAPGGIALLTVHSTRQFDDLVTQLEGAGEDPEPYRTTLERDGILFVSDDGFVGTTHPDWYHSTFHAPWYVYEHWRSFLTLRAHLHEGALTQDLIVLERPADGVAPLRPIGHTAPAAAAAGAAAPAPAPEPAPAPAPAQPAAPDTAVPGPALEVVRRVKRRALRAEHRRQQQQADELGGVRAELAALKAELAQLRAGGAGAGGDAAGQERKLAMMRSGLYAQGERISILERELREELAALHAAADDQTRSST